MTKKQEAFKIYSEYRIRELDDNLHGELLVDRERLQVVGFDYPSKAGNDVMIYGCDGALWRPDDFPNDLEKRILVKKVKTMLEYKRTIEPKDVYGSRYDGYSVGSTLSEYFNNSQEKVKILAFRPPVTGEYFISTDWKIGMASGSIKWHDPRLIVEFVKNKKYVFTEDKNGSYIKTTDGTFVNASCHTGTKYRLDVVEE